MKQFSRIYTGKIVFLILILYGCVNAKATDSTNVDHNLNARFEHIAFNVPDPLAMAKWYAENLGMKIMRSGAAPTYTSFIADSGMHMMLEILHNADVPLFESEKIHHVSIHLAFVTPDIGKTQVELVAAGAKIVDSLRKTGSGDQVLVLRDPWGMAIQFIQRVKPMLGSAGLYLEHFAINVSDARAKAQWYNDHLGMANIRQGSAPSFGTFIGDTGKNMMYELYQRKDYPVVDFSTINYSSFHVAFMVNDVKSARDMLIAAGASLAEEMKTIPSGDVVLMLRDPWNQPIQLVKRVNPMLK